MARVEDAILRATGRRTLTLRVRLAGPQLRCVGRAWLEGWWRRSSLCWVRVSFMERARPQCWGGFVTPASPRSPRTSGGLAACPCLSADGTAPRPPPDPGKAGWGFMLRQGLHSHQSRLPPGTSRGLWPCVHSPGLGEISDSQSRERWVGVQTRPGSWFPPVVCPSHQARVPPTNHVSLLSIVSRLICPAH